MPRIEAIQYINAMKKKKKILNPKSMVTIYKDKVIINTKNINKSKKKEIDELISKIKAIIE